MDLDALNESRDLRLQGLRVFGGGRSAATRVQGETMKSGRLVALAGWQQLASAIMVFPPQRLKETEAVSAPAEAQAFGQKFRASPQAALRRCVHTLMLLLFAAPAFAQAPIVVGPSSALAWDNLGVSPATAAGFTVNVTVDALPPKALTGVTCGPGPTAADATCQAPLAQLPTGSHAITLQNVSGGVASLPSVPLVYLDVLIPVPVNTRVKQ